MSDVLIINGPNLNMLGSREPAVYGTDTLADIERLCQKKGDELNLSVTFMQSNFEGEIVTAIQKAREKYDAIVINPAAYSHTSVAIMDALLCCGIPVVEVHLSNIHRREDFRRHSFVSQAAVGVICGFGKQGYVLALEAVASLLSKE